MNKPCSGINTNRACFLLKKTGEPLEITAIVNHT